MRLLLWIIFTCNLPRAKEDQVTTVADASTTSPSTLCPNPSSTTGYEMVYVLALTKQMNKESVIDIVENGIVDGNTNCFTTGNPSSLINIITPLKKNTDWCSSSDCLFKKDTAIDKWNDRVDVENDGCVVDLIQLAIDQLSNAKSTRELLLYVIVDLDNMANSTHTTPCLSHLNDTAKDLANQVKTLSPKQPIMLMNVYTTEWLNFVGTQFGVTVSALTPCTNPGSPSGLTAKGAYTSVMYPCQPPTTAAPTPAALSSTVIVGIVAAILGFCLIIAILIYCAYKNKLRLQAKMLKFRHRNRDAMSRRGDVSLNEMEREHGHHHRRHARKDRSSSANDRYKELPNAHHMSKDKGDEWELPRNRLSVYYNEKLGSGAFCNVFKGLLIGVAPVSEIHPSRLASQNYTDCEVAVKMLPEYADYLSKSDFLQEINFMKQLGYHVHLISLLGCITETAPLCMLTEYCAKGDLLRLVRKKKDEFLEINQDDENKHRFRDLLSYSWQISDGMAYLSSMGCIHRDVAARNVLVDAKNTAKIADFGLCRVLDQTIYTTRGGRLPIKWMSPESLIHYEYTTESDVWSYGVMLYEIFSFGEVPFPSIQPADIADFLKAGNRMERPENCPENIYELMLSCWTENPQRRPNFEEIREILASILESATEQYGYLRVDEENESANL